ncbi:MAG: hypothetical protein KatS3mg104_2593 [Phycisphaerae bacterium]|jgi:hypothetical protein|nr:MAG: hypothetical protein KatS3mg104_2593 [Phycisphaerae bacterium]
MSDRPIQSPPPCVRPVSPSPPDAREKLIQLAERLSHSSDVRLLREYLRLRARIRL